MPVKVLVVEDEPLVRMLAVDLIEDAGFEALEACNADEAILILDKNQDVRILMTDINMPGTMDGVRLATIARERFPLIEIVIVSGKIRLNSKQLPERSVCQTVRRSSSVRNPHPDGRLIAVTISHIHVAAVHHQFLRSEVRFTTLTETR